MKFGSVIFVFSLSLSFAYAASGTHKRWTVFDSLKDGFDAVYKYKYCSLFSHQEFKAFEGHTFDILLRKSTQENSNKFVMHVQNFQQLLGNNDNSTTDVDLEALLLPIIVLPKNDYKDVEIYIDHIYATEADTRKSVSWKYMAVNLLLNNKQAQIEELESSGLSTKEVTLGECTANYNLIKSNGEIGFEMVFIHDKCKLPLSNTLIRRICEFNATDIQESSEFKLGYWYDASTFQLLRTFYKEQGQLVNKQDTTFSLGKELHFYSFKEIKEVFDETKNTKLSLGQGIGK